MRSSRETEINEERNKHCDKTRKVHKTKNIKRNKRYKYTWKGVEIRRGICRYLWLELEVELWAQRVSPLVSCKPQELKVP